MISSKHYLPFCQNVQQQTSFAFVKTFTNKQSSIKCSHATTAWWAEQGSCEPISELRARSREREIGSQSSWKKCVNPCVIFGPFGGNCGPFWVIFGPLWIILGHSRAILGHLASYLGHFGPFWVILGPFLAIWGHIWAILGHFWAICSRDSRETLK